MVDGMTIFTLEKINWVLTDIGKYPALDKTPAIIFIQQTRKANVEFSISSKSEVCLAIYTNNVIVPPDWYKSNEYSAFGA